MSKSKIVVLDAGHGGTDPGAVNGARWESNDALKLAGAVERLLQSQGVTVIMTRSQDVHVSLSSRTVLANGSGADLFVSLHRNAFADSTAKGVEIWVYTTAGAVDEAAAGAVLEQLALAGIQSNRGVKKGNYHVLRESHMPAMLVELGFITNTVDNRLFDENFDAYAQAVAKGICEALGVTYRAPGTSSDLPRYKVQIGAFSVESNARAFLEQVRGMGLEAFLVRQDDSAAEAR